MYYVYVYVLYVLVMENPRSPVPGPARCSTASGETSVSRPVKHRHRLRRLLYSECRVGRPPLAYPAPAQRSRGTGEGAPGDPDITPFTSVKQTYI